MADDRIALMAHLMRRVGVGATRDQLEVLAKRPYEEVVEELIHPDDQEPDAYNDALDRYFPTGFTADTPQGRASRWIYDLANSKMPLREKMAMFWHHVFATGWFKIEHGPALIAQLETFRVNSLGNLRQILLDLAHDPAMIHWLDNSENHSYAVNENFGRELLELFTMGIGTYSEDDVKMAARAFTGWTFTQPVPLYPYGGHSSQFRYDPADHDDSEKTFLGHSGNLNGEDIIDIIVQQDDCARFISRHLYNFFVADEPQVPSWSETEALDPAAIEMLMKSFTESDGDMRAVMRTLLNADFFKEARFKRVKSPTELVGGALKLAGSDPIPGPAVAGLAGAIVVMGQKLLDPPSVEGWHTGKEWVDGGTLTERVNFAVDQVMDTKKPGMRSIVARISASGEPVDPEQFVDQCLDLTGTFEASDETRTVLREFADADGALTFGDDDERSESEARIGRMIQLIVASPEYQYT